MKLPVKLLPLFVSFLLFGCSPSKQPIRFALLTDTHISRNGGSSVEDLVRSIDEIQTNDSIDFVIISGDVTESGDKESMLVVKQVLERLTKPYYITSGNHETTWSESGVMDFSRVFGDNRFEFTYNGVYFIGFNSGPVIRMADGHVAPQDIAWLSAKLDSVNKKHSNIPIFVVTHYPLKNGDVDNWFDVTDVLRKYNVQAIIGGHYHRNLVYDADGIANVLGRSNLRDADENNGYTIVSVTKADSIRFYEKRIGETAQQWYSLAFEEKKYEAPQANLRPSYAINDTFSNVKEVWQTALQGGVYNTVAYAKDMFFVGDDVGTFYALNAEDGSIIWSFPTGMRILSAPCVAKNKVFFGSTDCNIYCLDITDGHLIWKFETPKAVMGCPIVENGVVYIAGSDGCMRALNSENGDEIWCFDQLNNYCTGKPIIANQTLYFGAWDCYFYALNTQDGSLKWKWSNGKPNEKLSPAAVWPVICKNKLFITAPDRYFTCLDCNTGKEIWRTNRYKVRETVGLSEDGKRVYSKCMWDTVIAVDAQSKDFKLVWATHVGFGYEHNPCMPVEKEGTLFVGTKNGVLYGLNAFNGEVKWQHKIGNSILNTPYAINGNECIISSSEGTITKIKVE